MLPEGIQCFGRWRPDDLCQEALASTCLKQYFIIVTIPHDGIAAGHSSSVKVVEYNLESRQISYNSDITPVRRLNSLHPLIVLLVVGSTTYEFERPIFPYGHRFYSSEKSNKTTIFRFPILSSPKNYSY
ncbi:hypothetical protein AFLA_000692 [Aspergillus flavus NRRL3357]|nr:hypothetical protein AFLA_000692 [Aspergillus flavus NRRL3357]